VAGVKERHVARPDDGDADGGCLCLGHITCVR
jgi:hypothetical protein